MRTWKQLKCPLEDEWIKKMWCYVCVCVCVCVRVCVGTHTLVYNCSVMSGSL